MTTDGIEKTKKNRKYKSMVLESDNINEYNFNVKNITSWGIFEYTMIDFDYSRKFTGVILKIA